MKIHSILCLSFLCFTQAQAFTLPTQTMHTYDCNGCEKLSHTPLSTSWVIQDNKSLGQTKALHKQSSVSYQKRVKMAELRNGFAFNTTAPGAVIRITPVNNKLNTQPEFWIKTSNQKRFKLREASSLFAQDEALANTLFAGQAASLLQLKPSLGQGEFKITAKGNQLADNEEFIIHIFDKFSPIYMTLETDRSQYQYGDELKTTITLRNNAIGYPIDIVEAYLVSPSGENHPLKINHIGKNRYQGTVTLLSDENPEGKNWYIEAYTVSIVGDQTITRMAHSAFSYAIPSATVDEIKQISSQPNTFEAKVDVTTGSRYAFQAVLYGSDAKGNMHPMRTIQSADWLSPGQNTLKFTVDTDKATFGAPYYLGYIHLIDFGQLKPVYHYDKPIALHKLI